MYSRERGTDLDIAPLSETVSWVKSMSDVLREREKPGEIVLSGPDCLRHPDIENILNLFADERRVGISFLGPLTGLSDSDVAYRVASLPTLRSVRLSLFGARPETHDRIVGELGAHGQVIQAMKQCKRYGVRVILQTIITPENVGEFPELLADLFLYAGNHDFHINLYHPENSWLPGSSLSWKSTQSERVVVHPRDVFAAFDQARLDEGLVGLGCGLMIPPCWLPSEWVSLARWEVHKPNRDRTFSPICGECAHRSTCPGIPIPAYTLFGEDCALPVRGKQGG